MKVEYQILKRKDNFCTDENQFINLLETNQNYKIISKNKIIEYKTLNIEYDIKKYETEEKNEIMFVIGFSLKNETSIEEFEKFDKSFVDFVSKFDDFSLNILWDDISRKYAEDIYPQIFYIENLLRKIIYYFMGKNVGNNWTVKCFPEKVDTSIKQVQQKNDVKTDENILYYADFIQLNFLLFEKYSNEEIPQNLLIEKLKDEKCNIKELISKYEYKSNWDRYFQPVVNKGNLENSLAKLYCYRNLVAHNRKIRKNDKDNFENLKIQVERILTKCLERINDIKVPENEKENLENMSSNVLSPLTYDIGDFQSVLNATRINSGIVSVWNSAKIAGINPATTSAWNSAKIAGINPAITSVWNSAKIAGINPAITPVWDFDKINLESNQKITSEINFMEVNDERQILTNEDIKEDENE